ncbi:MAG: MFS transporter [Gammaproteobacteria bacterium]|nr:MFS transporter [Gammaproteobacteria bacterium]
MKATIRAAWPLFFGIALLMIGNGLQGTLLGWRASLESFSSMVTGLIMTGYYLGFLTGSSYTPAIIRNVGHVRVFAAFASLASTSILVQAIYVTPTVWMIARVITGFCYAGLYIVVESWLNDRATNETRGSLFSIYMVISYLAMIFGQWTMKLADPGSFELFILVSVLISISLIPMLLTNSAAPSINESEKISLLKLFSISPLGMFGIFGTGIVHSVVFGMGAVYAARSGLSVQDTVLFISAYIAGGVLFQWPVGMLSDRYDRRVVITIVTFAAALFAFLQLQLALSPQPMFVLFGFYGGMSLPLYSLAISHTNDRLKPEQMIGASSGLIMLYGVGSSLGPLSVGLVLERLGDGGFFSYLSLIHALIGVMALIMMSMRKAVPIEEQTHFVPVPSRPTAVAAEAVAQIVEEEQHQQEEEGGANQAGAAK